MSLLPVDTLSLHRLTRMHYLSLRSASQSQVTYVYINKHGHSVKSKTRTLDSEPKTIKDVPEWQATYSCDSDSIEVTLVPVRIYRDPFTLDPNKLVLCETRELDGTAAPGNTRQQCVETMEAVKDHQPWFGFEQEFVLMTLEGLPFGWASSTPPDTDSSSLVGLDTIFGRDVSISHYNACQYAEVRITGTAAEEVPAQWEYQVGPCGGVELGDHTWMSRYILLRVCEDFRLVPSFHPKPVDSPKWASGGHMNYSTRSMRAEGGLSHILSSVQSLSRSHSEHMQIYGSEQQNQQRLNGVKPNSDFHTFTWSIAGRKTSIRIPGFVHQAGRGYLEDRRPPSDCDPYLVCSALVQTCIRDQDDTKERSAALTNGSANGVNE
ncbi:unnamed protein product [Knipowitschia caucasica]